MKGTRRTGRNQEHGRVGDSRARMPSRRRVDGDTDRERQRGKMQHVKKRQRNTPRRQHQEVMLRALGWLSGTKVTPNAAFPALKDLQPGTALHLPKQKQLLKFPKRDENEVQTSLLSSAPTHGYAHPTTTLLFLSHLLSRPGHGELQAGY